MKEYFFGVLVIFVIALFFFGVIKLEVDRLAQTTHVSTAKERISTGEGFCKPFGGLLSYQNNQYVYTCTDGTTITLSSNEEKK